MPEIISSEELGLPAWIIWQAERESARIGISPESLVNVWVEKMAQESAAQFHSAHQ